MSKKGIKMKDIANMLGVSTVTVSKALADKDGVSEELKKKIKETARELGYRNRDSMRSGSATNTVGILWPTILWLRGSPFTGISIRALSNLCGRGATMPCWR